MKSLVSETLSKFQWIPLNVDLDGVSLSLTGVSLYKGCLSQQVMLGGCQHQTATLVNHNQYFTYSCIYGIITYKKFGV